MDYSFDKSSLIYLLGAPAVGKYTTACEIARLTNSVVVDNQLVNNPLFTLFNWTPTTSLPENVWDYIAPVRESVFTALEDIAPRELSYVLTNTLELGDEENYERVKRVAEKRNAVFLPVFLSCDIEEQARRIPSESRIRRLKMSDVQGFRSYMDGRTMFAPDEPNLLRIDTTNSTPNQTAIRIIETANSLS